MISKDELLHTIKELNELHYVKAKDSAIMKKIYYTKPQIDIHDQCLTSLILINRLDFPKLRSNMDDKNDFTMYVFDDRNILMSKFTVHSGMREPVNYDYQYTDDHIGIRYGIACNSVKNIRKCFFKNDKIYEILNAYYDCFGELEYFSGEKYIYNDGNLSMCIRYRDCVPTLPLLKESSVMGYRLISNPVIEYYLNPQCSHHLISLLTT